MTSYYGMSVCMSDLCVGMPETGETVINLNGLHAFIELPLQSLGKISSLISPGSCHQLPVWRLNQYINIYEESHVREKKANKYYS